MTSCPIPRPCNLEIYIACLVNQFWPRLGILIFRQVTVPTSHNLLGGLNLYRCNIHRMYVVP